MKRERLFVTGIIAVLLCMVIGCTLIAFNCHISILWRGLRSATTTLISVRGMVTILLTKMLTGIVMLVAGIYCIFLHFQSLGSRSYTMLSCAFFLAAGIIVTLMDYKVIFYASSLERRIWQHFGDLFVLTLSALLQWLLLWDYNEEKHTQVIIPYVVFHVLLGVTMCCATIIQSEQMLFAYGCVICSMAIFQLLRMFGRTFSSIRLLRLLLTVLLDCFILVVAKSKLDSTRALYELYLNWSPYFLLLYLQIVFGLCFRYQRKSMALSRPELRRLEDIQAYMQVLSSNTIRNSCNLLDQLSRKAEAAGPEATLSLRKELSDAARRTADSLNMLRLYDFHEPMDNSQVSLHIFFKHVCHMLKHKISTQEVVVKIDLPDYTVLCDYALMARACVTLGYTLWELSADGALTVQAQLKEGLVQMNLSTRIAPGNERRVRKLRYAMHTLNRDMYDVTDEELSLLIAQRILAAHGTKIHVTYGAGRVQLQWSLHLAEPMEPAAVPKEREAGQHNEHAVQIALISTSATQTSLVAACLSDSYIALHTFRTAEKLYEHLRTNRVSVVIVGAMTVKDSAYDVCNQIRRNYTLGEMPIILLRNGSVVQLESWYIQVVNDVLCEPFSYAELTQRVFSLSMLQRSTLALQQARLEFLQSQMNPHFIFNVISAIMPLCMTNAAKAYDLLGSFSEYLRGNLFPKQTNTPIPVYEELDLVRAYVALENVRYQDRIHCHIVEDYSEEAVIYPLMLEPLVENCVKHGLRKDVPDAELHINVMLHEQDGQLDICVQDDGRGFDTTAFAQHEQEMNPAHHSVGLSNLNARLRLYYGTALAISSQVGEGTCITFSIPARGKAVKHHSAAHADT